MKSKDRTSNKISKSGKLGDSITEEDYGVLRSSEKQKKGIEFASEKLENALGVEKKKFEEIFQEVYTEMQIRESRYHYQMETDLPQAKLAMKKMLEPQLKEKVLDLIPNEKNYDELNRVIENLFQWYIREYLLES